MRPTATTTVDIRYDWIENALGHRVSRKIRPNRRVRGCSGGGEREVRISGATRVGPGDRVLCPRGVLAGPERNSSEINYVRVLRLSAYWKLSA